MAMTAPSRIRVMVLDASPLVRAGITAMLDRTADISVVGTSDDPLQVHRRCRDLYVDVLVVNPAVLDTGTFGAGGSGTRTAKAARWFDQLPAERVVVLTEVIDQMLVRTVSASGVNAFLHLPSVQADELASAIRGVMRGQATFSSEFLPDLVPRRPVRRVGVQLTAREGDILQILSQGHTNESIALALGLATGTVRVYVSGILAKLGAPNRTAAAVLAIREGLVAPLPETAPTS
jgi:DNA-binding NarL/FixJ family response regulator